MTETYKQGVCEGSKIRTKTWKAGFSLKCMTAKVVHTQVVTPYNEQYFKEAVRDFCKSCSEINKTKEMKP